MSSLRSSLVKSIVGLSSAELRRTSISDKQWLGISEEQLINEIFTDEFYRRLHNPTESIHSLNNNDNNNILEINKNNIEDKLSSDKIFLQYIIQSDHLLPNTINSLLKDLLQFTHSGEQFSQSLLKRIQLVRRIYIAALRERKRSHLKSPIVNNNCIDTNEFLSPNSESIPSIIRLSTRMFISTIRFQPDLNVQAAAIQSLNEMLPEFPLLSLFNDSDDCVDALQDFLIYIIKEQEDKIEKDEKKDEKHEKEDKKESRESTPKKRGHERKRSRRNASIKRTQSVQIILDARETLIGLVITRGSTKGILNTIKMLMNSKGNLQYIRVKSYLQRLLNYNLTLHLSGIGISYFGSWSLIWDENMELQFDDETSSLATNGSYLFLHCCYGLFKIGTGNNGTIKGKLYDKITNFYPGEKSSLICIQDLLYFRSSCIHPASFIIYSINFQEIGTIYQDGSGSIKTNNNNIYPFGPEIHSQNIISSSHELTSLESLQDVHNNQNKSLPNLCINRSHSITDGKYIYIISQICDPFHVDKYVIDKYNPIDKFSHILQISLTHEGNNHSSPLDSDIMIHGKFYTNGQYLIIIIPPPYASNYGYNTKQQICRKFSLKDGLFIENILITCDITISSIVYDYKFNEIWAFNGKTIEVGKFPNEGLAPKYLFPNSNPIDIHRIGEITLPDNSNLFGNQVAILLLQIISRLCYLSIPEINSISYHNCKLKEAFTVEINPELFTCIYSLLKTSEEQINLYPKEEINYDIISYCLRILRLNFHHLVAFSAEPYSNSILSNHSILDDIPINVLDKLRALLLRFINRKLCNNQSKQLLDAQIRVEIESCETLTVGFPIFYASYHQQSNFLLSLFEYDKNTNTNNNNNNNNNDNIGTKVLLSYVLDLLIDHQNSSYLLCPPNEKDFNPEVFLIPIISNLFRIASNLDNGPLISKEPKLLNIIKGSSEESRSALKLLFCFQKNLLLRVLETKTDINLANALVTYCKHIIHQCVTLIENAINHVAEKNSPKYLKDYINDDPQCIVIRALLPNLIHALFLFASNIWLAKELLPYISSLVYAFDKINRLGEEQFNINVRDNLSFSKQFMSGPSEIIESPHPYKPYSEIIKIIHKPGALYLSLLFDKQCNTAGDGDYLQLYTDKKMKEPFGDKYYGNQWPKNRVIIPGNTVVLVFRSNYTTGFWGYKCEISSQIPTNITSKGIWSVELERTLCGLGGRIASNLIIGQPLSDFEKLHKDFFNSILFKNGIELNYIKSISSSIHLSLIELFPEEIKLTKNQDTDYNIFIKELCDGNSSTDGCKYIDSLILDSPVPFENNTFKNNSIHVKKVKRYLIALLLKHHNLLSDIMLFSKSLKKGKHVKSLSPKHTRHKSISNFVRISSNKINYFQIISDEISIISKNLTNMILQLHQEYQYGKVLSKEISLNNSNDNIDIDDDDDDNSTNNYENICNEMILKLEFLLKFNIISKDKEYNISNSDITREIFSFLKKSLLSSDIQDIFEKRCKRAIQRSYGFTSLLDQITRAKYPGMIHEILCFLGKALRGNNQNIPAYYLDDINGTITILINLVRKNFFSLMTNIVSYISDSSNSDAVLQILALDTFALGFTQDDHEFLYNIDIFGKLYKLIIENNPHTQFHEKLKIYEIDHRSEISQLARNIFYFLGATCVNMSNIEYNNINNTNINNIIDDSLNTNNNNIDKKDNDNNSNIPVTKWQDSFFTLVISHLSKYVSQQQCERCYDICDCDIVEAIAQPAMSESREIEVEYIMGLLCVVSGTPIGKQCLSTPEFVKILINFIFCSREQLKIYTIRILCEILPTLSPNIKYGKQSLVTILLDLIGGVLIRSFPEQEDLGLEKFSVLQFPIIERSCKIEESKKQKDNSKLDSSHLFFNIQSGEDIDLPTGWNRTKILNIQEKEFYISSDNRTVSLIKIHHDNDNDNNSSDEYNRSPAFVIANKEITNNYPFHYFEMRIENIGEEGGTIFLGLLSLENDDLDSLDCYAFDKSGSKIRPPQEEKYSNEEWNNDDVIGCGWYTHTGEVFFTKNGRALGIAFKNVYGSFYPFVGIGSLNTRVLINFGQMPFRFDIEPSIELACSTISPSAKTHQCLSFVEDLIRIVRSLLSSNLWNDILQNHFIKALETCLSLLDLKKRKRKKKDKKISPLYPHMFACFAILGASLKRLKIGAIIKINNNIINNGGKQGIVIGIKDNIIDIALKSKPGDILNIISLQSHLVSIISYPILSIDFFNNIFIDNFFIFVNKILQIDNNLSIPSKYPMLQYAISICLRILYNWIKNTTNVNWLLQLEILLPLLYNFHLKPLPFCEYNINILENLSVIVNNQLFELMYGGFLHDIFEPASWIQENSINDNNLSIGKWYLIPNIGTGSEWTKEMDNTISYIGFVTLIDYDLKLVKLKLYDPEYNKISEWWYSINSLISCPITEIKWPFISNGISLEDSLKSVSNINRSLGIIYTRKILANYIGYYVGLNPLKISNTKLKPLSIEQILSQLKLYIIHNPYISVRNSYTKAYEYKRIKELRIIQIQLIQSIKQDMIQLNNNLHKKQNNNNNDNDNSNPIKTGFLLKKSKRFRTWAKLWFIAHENYVYYQRFQTSTSPMGAICLNDIIRAEAKGTRIFKITTQTREYILQAYSGRSLQSWLQIFQKRLWKPNEKNSNETEFPLSPKLLKTNKIPFIKLITNELLNHFNITNFPKANLGLESEHPYKRRSIKKMIHISGAEDIIIIFDPLCNIKQYDVLSFYSTGFGDKRKLLKSYSGKGYNIFKAFISSTNRIWMEFSTDSFRNESEWGFRFYVYALRMKIPENTLLYSHNIDFACCISEWLLHLSPVWIPNFYSLDIYNSLINHLHPNNPIFCKIRIINILIPLIQRINLFNQSPDLEKLQKLYQEFFILIQEQQKYPGLYSEYLQRLYELLVNCYLISGGKTFEFALTPISNNNINDLDTSIEEVSYSEVTEEQEFFSFDLSSQFVQNHDSYPPWFRNMIITISTLKQILEGDFFPLDFVKQACIQSKRRHIIQESPHPYPSEARVTASVCIPNATSLIVIFDPKSITEEGIDHLLFSKYEIGAGDIGTFSGNFGGKQIEIMGNSFVWSFLSDSSTSCNDLWGFRFTVIGKYTEDINIKLNEIAKNDFEITINTKNDWSLSMDYELINIIEQISEKLSKTTTELIWDDILSFPQELDIFGRKISIESIRQRFILLKYLNECVLDLLLFIDMQYVNEDWSLAFMIGAIRRLLFFDIKRKLLDEVLYASHNYRTSPIITLDRHIIHSNNNINNNNINNECLFIQAYKQLNHIDPNLLCQCNRAFTVKLVGEGAMDTGGPYREALSEFCDDIRSSELGLFIRCPNAQEEVGFNQDKFIPNPSACSIQELLQFEFLGKLIGIAIRTKNNLDLSFPSIIWKSLVYTKLEWNDLEAIDKNCCHYLELIREIHTTGVTEDTFYDLIFENFTTRSSDGRIIELKRNGKSCQVTWENRTEFTTLVELYRLNEFKKQTDAILKGIQSIIPSYLLAWFTWQQLEKCVCGDTIFDIELLKRHTIYVSVKPNDPHIILFWKVLDSFSSNEKALFIRFVWGRSQLPRESEFTTPFQLQGFPSDAINQDDLLPIAHTCFFSLALPSYSSKEIMYKRLVYAITTCREIDSDFVVPEGEFILQENEDN